MTKKEKKEEWRKRFDKLWAEDFSEPTNKENEVNCLDNQKYKDFFSQELAKEREKWQKKIKALRTKSVLKQIINELNYEIDNYTGVAEYRIYRWIMLRAIEIVKKYEKKNNKEQV